jgi:hypothetical protein
LARKFFANQGGFRAAYQRYASEIPTQSGEKFTDKAALSGFEYSF